MALPSPECAMFHFFLHVAGKGAIKICNTIECQDNKKDKMYVLIQSTQWINTCTKSVNKEQTKTKQIEVQPEINEDTKCSRLCEMYTKYKLCNKKNHFAKNVQNWKLKLREAHMWANWRSSDGIQVKSIQAVTTEMQKDKEKWSRNSR